MNPIDPASPELTPPQSPQPTTTPKMNRAAWTQHIEDCAASELSMGNPPIISCAQK